MASSAPNKAFAVRAAAILTNSEVKGNNFDLNNAWGSKVAIETSFTLGSLTNGIFKTYVSMDGTTWFDLKDSAGNNSYTLTADGMLSRQVEAPGWKFLTVGVTGTGTVTSSSATVNFRSLKRGSQ